MKRTLFLILLLTTLLIVACAKSEEAPVRGSDRFTTSETSQGKKDGYLAYEHEFTIDIAEHHLSKAYKGTLDACIKDAKSGCTILDSKISTGEYPSANIRIRIKPEGINEILRVASSGGQIVGESTHVEDLAKPIIDNKNQLKMLESHRARLIEIQRKAASDVDALIKVSSELAKVQTELERATGDQAFLNQRVNKDIVSISFRVEYNSSFWRPILRSLSRFTNSLSGGVAGTIIAVAYLMPGAVVLLVLFLLWRYIRKRMKKQ